MARTRAAILAAAADCVARQGVRRTAMTDVAAAGRLAKATLYNHFRTKDDLLVALVEEQVATLEAECSALADLPAAAGHAASRLGGSPLLARIRADEPAILTALVAPGDGPLWAQAREAVARVLKTAEAPADQPAVELVLRWLVSHVAWPGEPEAVEAGARVLARGLSAFGARAGDVPSG